MAQDDDLRQQCAFQFPAVIVTIGRGRWFEVREAFLSLARSDCPELRRSLSCSLHEVARVLGPDLSENELVPVFEAMLNDSEAISFGVTSHLADFLANVSPSWRVSFLPALKELLDRAMGKKWRSRETISWQLRGLASLLRPADAHDVLVPLVAELLHDKVAQVRQVAIEAAPAIAAALASGEAPELQTEFVDMLKALAGAGFQERQTFVLLACNVMQTVRTPIAGS